MGWIRRESQEAGMGEVRMGWIRRDAQEAGMGWVRTDGQEVGMEVG